MIDVFGPGRVGIKLSPLATYNDMFDSNPNKLYGYLLEQLSNRKIAFVEMLEGVAIEGGTKSPFITTHPPPPYKGSLSENLRNKFTGAYIANWGYDFDKANEAIEKGQADAVSFG